MGLRRVREYGRNRYHPGIDFFPTNRLASKGSVAGRNRFGEDPGDQVRVPGAQQPQITT